MTKKNLSFIIITAVTILISFVCFIYLLFFTSKGSQTAADFAFSNYLNADDFSFERVEGDLKNGLSLYNVLIENSAKLPPGAVIKIQRIDMVFREFRLSRLEVEIYNGRLKLPFSDAVLFYGNYKQGLLDLNIYSKKVSAREIIDLFTHKRFFSTLSGVFNDVNLHIVGKLNQLAMEGSFFVEKIVKGNFSISGSPGSVMMYCDDLFESMHLNGEIVLKSGTAAGRNTAVVALGGSKIVFESDPKTPKLNIRGRAEVDDVKINAVLQGTFNEPELKMSSYPPLTEDLLLVMLATGRSWGSVPAASGEGPLSANLVRDFVDYFIFGGKGSQLAGYLGISDISLIYDQDTKVMGVETALADKVRVSYEVEPQTEENGNKMPKQTVGGKLKITDTVSVEAEKELSQKVSGEEEAAVQEGEGKVFLQFKKQF